VHASRAFGARVSRPDAVSPASEHGEFRVPTADRGRVVMASSHEGVRISVRVRPGARRDAVGGSWAGPRGPALVVAVRARAIEWVGRPWPDAGGTPSPDEPDHNRRGLLSRALAR
jgi:hypothetical protein